MKKLTTLFLAAFVCTTVALAQDSSVANHKMHHSNTTKPMKDCVMMKDGKMMVMKDGKTMAMDQDISLTNGATVTKGGTVKMKDGTSKQLNNGDCVYMDGKIVAGMKKDATKKKTE